MSAALLKRPAATPRALGTVRHFARHQTIFAQGDPVLHIMLVIHGMVRSCSNFSDGRRFISSFYTGGDLFGLERSAVHPGSAEAVCETVLVLYPAPDWLAPSPAQDDLAARIFTAMMQSIEQARRHAQLLGRLHAMEKLSVFLLECSARAKERTVVTLEMTRQDIADYLGLTVETVSRGLAQLRRDGTIAFISARQIKLLNLAALRAVGTCSRRF
jgi:CRP/FNR family nitrogen fixation transcriptional regulator